MVHYLSESHGYPSSCAFSASENFLNGTSDQAGSFSAIKSCVLLGSLPTDAVSKSAYCYTDVMCGPFVPRLAGHECELWQKNAI